MTTRQIQLEALTLPPLDRFRLAQMLLGSLDIGQLVNGYDEHKVDETVTVEEAADLLNVSEPHLITLLERNVITHKKVGTEYHVYADNLRRYKQEMYEKRMAVLDELTQEAQELNMGY